MDARFNIIAEICILCDELHLKTQILEPEKSFNALYAIDVPQLNMLIKFYEFGITRAIVL